MEATTGAGAVVHVRMFEAAVGVVSFAVKTSMADWTEEVTPIVVEVPVPDVLRDMLAHEVARVEIAAVAPTCHTYGHESPSSLRSS